jgi:hypothetical protein
LVIDEVAGRANLFLLPNGEVNYDMVVAMGLTPDGSRLYFANSNKGVPSVLAYYDLATATVHEIGQLKVGGQTMIQIHQMSFSPAGTLYITAIRTEKLYTVNLDTAVATEVGVVVNQATGVSLNIDGADIAFKRDGRLYLWINIAKTGSPRGTYLVNPQPVLGKVNATFLSNPTQETHQFRGLAFRFGGTGNLVGSEAGDRIHVHNPETGNNVVPPMPLYLNGQIFDARGGDMSTGPFLP